MNHITIRGGMRPSDALDWRSPPDRLKDQPRPPHNETPCSWTMTPVRMIPVFPMDLAINVMILASTSAASNLSMAPNHGIYRRASSSHAGRS